MREMRYAGEEVVVRKGNNEQKLVTAARVRHRFKQAADTLAYGRVIHGRQM